VRKLTQKIYKRVCSVCETQYETTSSWGKYCQQACRQKSFRTNKTAKSIENVTDLHNTVTQLHNVETQLHNVVTVLRNANIKDKCFNCGNKRTLLEQTINRSNCFECSCPNWTVITCIKEGAYPEDLYPNDPLIKAVKRGDWDSFLNYHNIKPDKSKGEYYIRLTVDGSYTFVDQVSDSGLIHTTFKIGEAKIYDYYKSALDYCHSSSYIMDLEFEVLRKNENSNKNF